MRKLRFSEHQIVRILKEVEGGRAVKDTVDLPPISVPPHKLELRKHMTAG